MPVQVTAIMLGVGDVARARKFYGEGLGCAIDQDHPGVRVVRPGRRLLVAGPLSTWGGYFGYFSDPDGYLWKVASSS